MVPVSMILSDPWTGYQVRGFSKSSMWKIITCEWAWPWAVNQTDVGTAHSFYYSSRDRDWNPRPVDHKSDITGH